MNYHIMNVEKEPRNQIFNQHDHDNKNDHNHEDTYWEHFLETKDESTTTYQTLKSASHSDEIGKGASSLFTTNSEGEYYSDGKKHNQKLDTMNGIGNKKQLSLHSKWNYYYHLPNDKNWNLASYKPIMGEIDTLEKLIAVNETVTNNIIKNCMLFVMREGVTPMWEDSCNRNGGCFSYKVTNKVVVSVWRELTYLLCGNSLTIDKNHMELVNGITISPKRGFCIVKIWLKNCSLQDPNIVVDVDNLIKVGCLFKTHKAEF